MESLHAVVASAWAPDDTPSGRFGEGGRARARAGQPGPGADVRRQTKARGEEVMEHYLPDPTDRARCRLTRPVLLSSEGYLAAMSARAAVTPRPRPSGACVGVGVPVPPPAPRVDRWASCRLPMPIGRLRPFAAPVFPHGRLLLCSFPMRREMPATDRRATRVLAG